ncbi:MAG: cyanophycinase [Dysgonamonadaceae bacterium]|jgi:cyanophycinase|nr:cyanophycinase [Dysgonamonadaceae bacterium]
MNKEKRKLIVLVTMTLFIYVTVWAQPSPITIKKSKTRHGPERGALIISGGGGTTAKIRERFLELAGGKENAHIVVITTNSGDSAAYNIRAAEQVKEELGVEDVTILHTASLVEANSDVFIEPLKKATAVYFVGGRQWRAADSYLNTRTHQAFLDVLDRGGVIFGGSAGASIQGSFLWRGDTSGPHILIGNHTQGLGFLKNSVIDQHLLRRNRQFDLLEFIKKSPELIGIGLDEKTAILVQRDILEVLGESYAVIYDHNTILGKGNNTHVVDNKEVYTASNGPFFFLYEGQKYDLSNRQVINRPPRRFDSPANSPASAEGTVHGIALETVTAPSPDSELFARVSPVTARKESTTRHGPEKGSLIIAGSGFTPEVWDKFLELAGGKEKANIVVITAAAGDSAALSVRTAERIKQRFGIENVITLHTKSLEAANSEEFIEPLKKATGVFFEGGRQWRIADSYLNTLAHQAFWDVLDRGGVIIGGSAGASIQGSFLWRGDTAGPHILIGDHTQGLGFLKNSAIDQHLLRRNRAFDLIDFIRSAPDFTGIGLDETAAILVRRDTLEVIGNSYAAIYDYNTVIGRGNNSHVVDNKEVYTASNGPFFFLHKGQKYDLKERKVIK